jgi:hypothetical protein
MGYVVVGVSSKTGTINRLKPMERSGKFQLTAPGLTSEARKDPKNYTLVDMIEEAIELIGKGYYARMHNVEQTVDGSEKQAPDIIKPEQIHVFKTND